MQALLAQLRACQLTDAVDSEQQNTPDTRSVRFRNYSVIVTNYLGVVGIAASVGAAVGGAVGGAIGGAVGGASGAAGGATAVATILGINLPVSFRISNLLDRQIKIEQQGGQDSVLCRFRDRSVTRTDVILLLKYIVAQAAAGAATAATSGATTGAAAAGAAAAGAPADTGSDVAYAGAYAAQLGAISGAAIGTLLGTLGAAIHGSLVWYNRTTPVIDNQSRTQPEPDIHLSTSISKAHETSSGAPGTIASLNPEPVQLTDAMIEIPLAGEDQV